VSKPVLCLVILALGMAAYLLATLRARRLSGGKLATLHSRLSYYGAYAALSAVVPTLALVVGWSIAEPVFLKSAVHSLLPADLLGRPKSELAMIDSAIGTVAQGLRLAPAADLAKALADKAPLTELFSAQGIAMGAEPEAYQIAVAQQLNRWTDLSRWSLTLAALALALLGGVFALLSIRPTLRARNSVERVMLAGLMAASTVAILTTVGIIASMLFETIHFFQLVPAKDYFLSLVWDPRFSAAGATGGSTAGQFGLIPLLWGTAYISLVALIVAVPVGLMAALYLSEYASSGLRTVVKPALELLAGIPTIVYGLFALISFGPTLRDLGASIGVPVSASSVLTAGIVMGIMLIPFVSSLSDDVINAVPQTLREGSLGLGATRSETIKLVVLPAALPGVIGAVLLAASRAIGETMIVVLAAGIAANITANPLQPVTTMTVKIVSQLTGDLEFNSPQTLVAFALGLTLFCITLVLNIYALSVVRRFREHYE